MVKAAQKVNPKKKPGINKLWDVFTRYQSRVQQVQRVTSVRNVKEWQARMEEARAAFKEDMEELGIAQHFDWAEDNQA